MKRGAPQRQGAEALVAHLPRHIFERELTTLQQTLPGSGVEQHVKTVSTRGAGNVLILMLGFEHSTIVVHAIGQKGIPAEESAGQIEGEARASLCCVARVGRCLADQLLPPVASGGGKVRTTRLTAHVRTSTSVIEQFVGPTFAVDTAEDGGHTVARA